MISVKVSYSVISVSVAILIIQQQKCLRYFVNNLTYVNEISIAEVKSGPVLYGLLIYC